MTGSLGLPASQFTVCTSRFTRLRLLALAEFTSFRGLCALYARTAESQRWQQCLPQSGKSKWGISKLGLKATFGNLRTIVGILTLSFLSLILWISLVNFKQGISLVILVFPWFFQGFQGFGREGKSLVNLGFSNRWAAANGGVINGGLRGVWPPFLEIGRNRPKSPFFCLLRPFPEGAKSTWEIQKTEEKGLFPQISSDLLKPPSLKPPFAALQTIVGILIAWYKARISGFPPKSIRKGARSLSGEARRDLHRCNLEVTLEQETFLGLSGPCPKRLLAPSLIDFGGNPEIRALYHPIGIPTKSSTIVHFCGLFGPPPRLF